MNNVECPECGAEIAVSADSVIGEIVICAECSTEFEVVSLKPLELAMAPEIEEDWGE